MPLPPLPPLPPGAPPSPPLPSGPPPEPASPPHPPGSQVVSDVSQLIEAIQGNADRIILTEGTYELSTSMCTYSGGAGLCIYRRVAIEAAVHGTAFISGMSQRRTMYLANTADVEVVGVSITGGYADVH
jgi:hypothetical protein